MASKPRPRVRRRPRSTLPEKDVARHTVYYRATQVTYSMPCFEETRVPKVGMRLAVLNFSAQQFSGAIPNEKFYPGRIVEVTEFEGTDHLVTVEFDGTMPATKRVTIGWKYFGKFCIPLPAEMRRLRRKYRL